MPEIEVNENEEMEVTAADYVQNLKAVRSNMVSKAEYDRLQAENKQLADALMNSDFREREEPKPKADIEKLREKFLSREVTNDVDMWTNTLDLRDALIEAGERDPFIPGAINDIPTGQQIEDAERVASNIREVLDYAEGDPTVFKNELQRRCGIKNKIK